MRVYFRGREIDPDFNGIVIPIHYNKSQPVIIEEAVGQVTIKLYNGATLLRTITAFPFSGRLEFDLCTFACLMPIVYSEKPYSAQSIVVSDSQYTYTASVVNQNADTYDLSSTEEVRTTNGDVTDVYLGGESGQLFLVDMYLKDGTKQSVQYTAGRGDFINIENLSKLVIGEAIHITYKDVCSGITVKWTDRFGNTGHYTFESYKTQEQYVDMSGTNAIDSTIIQVDAVANNSEADFFNFICRASNIEVYNSNTRRWVKAKCTNKAGAVFNNSDTTSKIVITLSCEKWN